jgi:hypothetical protein
MKPIQFELLEQTEKAQFLLCKGVEVGKRVYKGFDIHLFQIHGFYVEIFCHKASGTVNSIRAFEGGALLEPYLETINIDSLFQC